MTEWSGAANTLFCEERSIGMGKHSLVVGEVLFTAQPYLPLWGKKKGDVAEAGMMTGLGWAGLQHTHLIISMSPFSRIVGVVHLHLC